MFGQLIIILNCHNYNIDQLNCDFHNKAAILQMLSNLLHSLHLTLNNVNKWDLILQCYQQNPYFEDTETSIDNVADVFCVI